MTHGSVNGMVSMVQRLARNIRSTEQDNFSSSDWSCGGVIQSRYHIVSTIRKGTNGKDTGSPWVQRDFNALKTRWALERCTRSRWKKYLFPWKIGRLVKLEKEELDEMLVKVRDWFGLSGLEGR